MPCAPAGSCVDNTARTPAFASSEGTRIAQLLESSRQCMVAQSLAKARAFSSSKACAVACALPPASQATIPSMLLAANTSACYTYPQPNDRRWEVPVPESVRIANLQQRTIDESTSSTDPDKRFSMYFKKFTEPCPPDPAWYKNAGEPVLQGKNCPLPNSPLNPVLPG
jgi:hypothetical protein